MKDIIKKIFDKAFVPCAICVYLIIISVTVVYGTDPYLWFDEAGQFWMSKGLTHDSAPLSQIGSLADVVISNQGYNLDPGGFTILLYFWSMISNNYIWLRMLPFTFFLITVGVFIYLGYSWTKNKYIAALLGFVPFFISMIYGEALELRAYSMEVCGVAISILAIDSLQKKITYKRLILWSIAIAIFLTSRYSFIIVAFTTSTFVLYLIYKQTNDTKQMISMAIAYAIPLLIMLCYDYFFAMRFQNPTLDTLFYLPYISTNPKVLFHNSSLRHFFYLGVLAWLYFQIRNTKFHEKYTGIIYVAIITNLFFFVFSCLGMHPWDGGTTRCISMFTVVVISISALWAELLNYASSRKVDIKYVILAFVCLQCLQICKYTFKESHQRDNAFIDIKSLEQPYGKIYVDRWESPCLRYQFEYGHFKGYSGYPGEFNFATFRKHGAIVSGERKLTLSEWYETCQPDLNDLMEYDVLVVPELYEYRSNNYDKWQSINDNNRIWEKKNQCPTTTTSL